MALRFAGIDSYTFVDDLYSINNRSDFDFYLIRDSLAILNRCLPSLVRSVFFVKFLSHCDVLITNFDGGLLRKSKIRFLEHLLLKIAKKSLVVWPYGSDSFVYSQMADHSFRYGIYKSYPEYAKKEVLIRRQINYFVQTADLIIGNIPHHEALPRWDVLTVACYGVDTKEWLPSENYKYYADGHNNVVTILHCPNHRCVKGTDFIIKAVDELKRDGHKVKLKIMEGVKNEEILKEMQMCDIVVAQLLYGYASTEIEGMSLAKPVISNLEFSQYYDAAKNYTYFMECPLVSASPLNLKFKLLELIESPKLRKEIGVRGRGYVEKFHSLEGQGVFWSKVVGSVRSNKTEELSRWFRAL